MQLLRCSAATPCATLRATGQTGRLTGARNRPDSEPRHRDCDDLLERRWSSVRHCLLARSMRGARSESHDRMRAPRIVLGRSGDGCSRASSDWSLGSRGASRSRRESASRPLASTVARVGFHESAHAGRIAVGAILMRGRRQPHSACCVATPGEESRPAFGCSCRRLLQTSCCVAATPCATPRATRWTG